jgi:hypothetical protein
MLPKKGLRGGVGGAWGIREDAFLSRRYAPLRLGRDDTG